MGDLKIQNVVPLLGTAASPVTLTGSYSDASSARLNVKGKSRVVLYVYYTMGAAETSNSIQIKVQASPTEIALDSVLWGRLTTTAASSGTVTHTNREDTFSAVSSAGTYDVFPIEITDLNTSYIKVSVKETGIAANGGSCYVVAETFGR